MGGMWALVRILRPSRYLAAADALGRLGAGTFMIASRLAGGTPLTAWFRLSEWTGGLASVVFLLPRGTEGRRQAGAEHRGRAGGTCREGRWRRQGPVRSPEENG